MYVCTRVCACVYGYGIQTKCHTKYKWKWYSQLAGLGNTPRVNWAREGRRPPGEEEWGGRVEYNVATLLDADAGASALVLRDVHAALIKVCEGGGWLVDVGVCTGVCACRLLHERHGYVHVHVAGGSKIHAEKKVQSFVASGTTR